MNKTYSTDVLPLFRAKDISCMGNKNIRLGDVEWMCDPEAGHGFEDHGNARLVFSVLLQGFMPPDGPWAQSSLNIFDEWIKQGFLK